MKRAVALVLGAGALAGCGQEDPEPYAVLERAGWMVEPYITGADEGVVPEPEDPECAAFTAAVVALDQAPPVVAMAHERRGSYLWVKNAPEGLPDLLGAASACEGFAAPYGGGNVTYGVDVDAAAGAVDMVVTEASAGVIGSLRMAACESDDGGAFARVMHPTALSEDDRADFATALVIACGD